MNKLDKSINWLKDEAANTSFGIVELSVVLHNGKIKRIEKTVTKKELIDGEDI